MALPKVALPTYELVVPSNGKKIKYRPFVVKEEKLLLLALETEDEKQIEAAIRTLLKNCIQSRIKVDDLTMFDLELIFLNIRAVSVGEVVELQIVCKDDNETKVPYQLNLGDVEVIYPKGHNKKIEIGDKMGIIMKYPGYNQFVAGSIVGKEADADNVIHILADCIDQIYDGEEVYDSSTTTKKEFIEFIEGLTTSQFEKVTAFFETAPRVEHRFKVKNPNTGVESDYTITGLNNFFG
jgi:hypothetical protein|tara:strand:+ start:2089 stop:2802 length:714 start_codon:yes stop_codon:yes gene_type:complete